MKIRALGQIESGKRKVGVLFFSIRNLGGGGGSVDILCSLALQGISM